MSPENLDIDNIVFACSSRGTQTSETTEGEQVREIALKHVFFLKKDFKKIDPIMNFVSQQ